jgi:hypothetical protein
MLAPTYALTIGSSMYDTQCQHIRLRRTCLPATDRLEVLMPRNVDFSASVDDDGSLDIDGGDGSETVFTGKLGRIEQACEGLYLTFYNHGLTLSRFRPYYSLEGVTTADVIQNICSDASVNCDVSIPPVPLAWYAVEGRLTGAQEIARLAALSGGRCCFSGDGTCKAFDPQTGTGRQALLYGREIIGASGGNFSPDPSSVEFVGDGAAAPSSSQGRWVITNFSGGSGSPGAFARRIAQPLVRTSSDAGNAVTAFDNIQASRQTPVQIEIWLVSSIEPGTILEIQEMPDYCPIGSCTVSQVVYTIDAVEGARCRIWGSSGGSASSPGGLF